MNILISDTLISQFKNVKVKIQTNVPSVKTIQYKRSRPIWIFTLTLDLLSSLNAVISDNERIEFITCHVIFNGAYNEIFQLKTT